MGTGRLEAFSDGVIAIVITIIVLLIDLPDGDDIGALARMVPLVAAYAVSFILIGMRWANHHHLLQVTEKVNGKIMWANLLYLFALSLYPIATGWVGKTNFAALPTTVFASLNLFETLVFILLERAILSSQASTALQSAVKSSKKELYSILLELSAILCSLFVPLRAASYVLLLLMSGLWIVPDLRMKRAFEEAQRETENGG